MFDFFNMLCFHFVIVVLLRKRNFIEYSFSNLFNEIFSMFSNKSSMQINKKNVSKLQISTTFDFVIIDYKIQNVIFVTTILNFCRNENNVFVMKNHRKFCFTYVQISKFQIFDDLKLLKKIEFFDINNKSHFNLLLTIKIFDEFSKNILTIWKKRFIAKKNERNELWSWSNVAKI